MTNADDQQPHTEIARRFLHERSDVRDPQVSPDGRRIAHVVTTCDLDQNTTVARIWLDGTPVSAGPHDSQPRWSPTATGWRSRVGAARTRAARPCTSCR
ncbi:MAG: hypothetical protein R2697_17880 [Ilumatobacteraceae bacterium]